MTTVSPNKQLDYLNDVKLLLHEEMQQVEQEINGCKSDISTINDISTHIMGQGGKRIRPVMMILAALSCNYKGKDHVKLAVILELIHASTLLHDDVIDNSNQRRHKQTVNAIWDNKCSVLAGDYLYALAFRKMTETADSRVIALLARATSFIVEGELLQLTHNRKHDLDIDSYLDVIARKTAKLFSVASELGALIANKSPEVITQMHDFGHNFGMAYQIANDIADYTKGSGKSFCDDLAEGKPTLPFIFAYKNSNHIVQQQLAMSLGNAAEKDITLKAIKETNALKLSFSLAEEYVNKAYDSLDALPTSPYKKAMTAMLMQIIKKVSNCS